VLGGIGACLTTSYFSNVCWGSIPPTIAFGLDLLAMGALIKRDNLPVWLAPALAGFAVGMNVVEAADIGALLSLVVAAFAFFQALAEDGTPLAKRVIRGVWRTAVVSIFAGFIAAYAVSVLITANITGIAGTNPSWDRYFAGKGPLPNPRAYLRHTGRGIYIGALIVFIACCAGVQSLR